MNENEQKQEKQARINVNDPSIWGTADDPLWRARILETCSNAPSALRGYGKLALSLVDSHREEIKRLTAERDALAAQVNAVQMLSDKYQTLSDQYRDSFDEDESPSLFEISVTDVLVDLNNEVFVSTR